MQYTCTDEWNNYNNKTPTLSFIIPPTIKFTGKMVITREESWAFAGDDCYAKTSQFWGPG